MSHLQSPPDVYLKLLSKGREIWNRWARSAFSDSEAREIYLYDQPKNHNQQPEESDHWILPIGAHLPGRIHVGNNSNTETSGKYFNEIEALSDQEKQQLSIEFDVERLPDPESRIEIENTLISSQFPMWGLVIPADISFKGTEFQNEVFLSESYFNGSLELERVIFRKRVYLNTIVVKKDLNLNSLEADEPIVSRIARIGANCYCYYSKLDQLGIAWNIGGGFFSSKSNFKSVSLNARFCDKFEFTFNNISGNLEVYGVFEGIAIFDSTAVDGNVRFDATKFLKNATFNDATFKSMSSFARCEFNSRAEFINVEFAGRTIFSGGYFKGAPLFFGAKIHPSISFEKREFLDVAEVVPINRDDLSNRPVYFIDFPDLDTDSDSSSLAAGAWQFLKRSMSENKKHELESKFYSFEIKARKPNMKLRESLVFDAYWLFSNYGNSIYRPLASLIFL